MRARLEAMERQRTEPIAIVGIGCRFPGGANGPGRFWQMLCDGVDATREVPADRWDVEAYFDADPEKAGAMYVRRGAFLDGVDQFDPEFFGIWPREAASMDPQQRLLLETAWEAIEDAGIPRAALAGRSGGVYVGVMFHDYAQMVASAGLEYVDTHFGTGNGVAFLAGRLSHQLGMMGPSLVVDTACSSSLVAVHLACQSLRSGETDVGLACGVNLILSPLSNVVMCRLRALSPDGRCKTFDAAADGYVRGEGCGAVVLKRLSDAVADGDRIWGVVRGSAVNQDGAGAGLTVPNGLAQQAVIRKAMAEAKVSAGQIGYVEAHGTGTRLGDPLELRSLWSVLKEGRSTAQPIVVGALKTNVGHMEGAAGIGSLIKTVLALKHGKIPPHLHLQQLNPLIAEEGIPLEIPRSVMGWPAIEGERVAGVSSFGMSGTNAHVIVAEGPSPAAVAVGDSRRDEVLCLSARTPEQLRELGRRYREWLAGEHGEELADVCYTAAVGRTHWKHRVAIVAANLRVLQQRLGAWIDRTAETTSDNSTVSPSGQAQWSGHANAKAGTAPATYGADAIARAYMQGEDIDWAAAYRGRTCRKVSLPTYPFHRQRYWVDLPVSPAPAARRDLKDVLYDIAWQPKELAATGRAAIPHSLIVGRQQGLETDLAEALRRQGTVRCIAIEHVEAGEFEGQLREVFQASAGQRVDVVFAVSDQKRTQDGTALHLPDDRISAALLRVMQDVARLDAGAAARLWVVTRGVHAIEHGDSVRPGGAVAWGLGKAFALEHPDSWGGLIDLPAATGKADASLVLAEIASASGEDQVAWRSRRRYVARVTPFGRALPADEIAFDTDAVYWIAGGLGAIGLQTAEWMAQRGARHFVLQGRRGLPDRESWQSGADFDEMTWRRIDGVRRIESFGATVCVMAADLASNDLVARARTLLEEIGLPLGGVVHAAGVSELCDIVDMRPEDLQEVLAAKVRGLVNLHEVAKAYPEALFACFSSIASVWGSRSLGS